jgi:hypothetical protein
MGITDFFSDLMASVGLQEAHAEAPAGDEQNKDEGGDEGGEEKEEDGGEEDAGGDEGGEEAEEEEEEEDDEPVDLKPKLEAGMSTHYTGYDFVNENLRDLNYLRRGSENANICFLSQNAQDQPNAHLTNTITMNVLTE